MGGKDEHKNGGVWIMPRRMVEANLRGRFGGLPEATGAELSQRQIDRLFAEVRGRCA